MSYSDTLPDYRNSGQTESDREWVERRVADRRQVDRGVPDRRQPDVPVYHGVGNFDAPSSLVIGGRAQALLNAYLLWFFLGWVSAHRVFLKSPLTATAQAVFLWLGVALWFQNPGNHAAAVWLISVHCLWRIADLFLIPDLVRANAELDTTA